MRNSRVLTKVRQGGCACGVALQLASADMIEMASLMGIEVIWLDLEHRYHTLETTAHMMRAARVGGTDIVARPAKGEFMRMGRLLEIGANGIMYPRCESAAEAAEVVRWAKFPPLGKRGFDGGGADVPFLLTPLNQYLKHSVDQTFVIIQIENRHALEQVEEIAAVPGVDFLMLGPGDFSLHSGFPGEFGHPEIQAAYERIAKAAKQANIHWAATCGSIEQAAELRKLGASLVFHGCDLAWVYQGLERVKQEFEEHIS